MPIVRSSVPTSATHLELLIIQHLDITERKQAEAALTKTVEELRVAEQRQRELLAVTRREQGRL
jgi:hypothetical protein